MEIVQKREVYVVIAVHDRWELTRGCLRALTADPSYGVHVVVIDDGSTDGTSALIAHEFPGITVLSGDGSLWWAGATALGVKWVLARCAEADLILTMNNDTTVDLGYVDSLVGVFAREGGHVVVGSVAVDSRDQDTVFDGGPQVNWLTAKTSSAHAGESLTELRARGLTTVYPDRLSGRGTLIPVACIRDIGNFDATRLPHYAADYEFSARAALAGYKLVMSYDAAVHAVVEATGVTTRHGRLPWGQFLAMFTSRRSSACLLYRWRYGMLVVKPAWRGLMFTTMDTLRVVVGGFRDQIRGSRGCARSR